MNKKIKNILILYYLSLVFVLVYLAITIFCLADNNLQVIFFNVGQGDSILIQLPDHRRILIDGGPDNTVLYRLGEYLPYFDRQLDLVILTHPDADHLNGLIAIIRRYQVKAILLSGSASAEPAFSELENLIIKKNIRLLFAKDTKEIHISAGIDLKIINPKKNADCASLNDCSVVAKLQANDISFLFTGDIAAETERRLIKDEADLAATVLKVSHHGSRFSTGDEFLARVKPSLAIISVGENRFGHPSPEVIDRLRAHGILTLTTLAADDIMVFSDGARFWLRP